VAEVMSRFASVDGLRAHYLTAGEGPPLVLLHGGAWGECARTAWPATIAAFATRYRVLAPDWLGFGEADMVVDFADRAGRMLGHLAGLLDHLGVGTADMVGLSMGGAHLLRDQTSDAPRLDVRRLVLVSAGGPPISGQARQALASFDGTLESMRAQVRLAFADPSWAEDEEFVRARHREATRPGAYPAFASLWQPVPVSLGPASPGPASPGSAPGDTARYPRITVPTLVTAGAADRLKPPGYAEAVAAAIPGAELAVFGGCGHCPQLEAADAWNGTVLGFLDGERA
jgi:2-hydroxymuconate-semialdehyde hydrolase